jgi:hypothetical protein
MFKFLIITSLSIFFNLIKIIVSMLYQQNFSSKEKKNHLTKYSFDKPNKLTRDLTNPSLNQSELKKN